MRPSFEWDDVKNEQNKEKHGVSFFDAQYAFADPHRVIIEDLAIVQTKIGSFVLARSKVAS